MAHTIKSKRGGDKLVDENKFIYRLEKKYAVKTYWKCDTKMCSARVHSVVEDGRIIICRNIGEHCHSSNPSQPIVQSNLGKIKSLSMNSQLSSRSIIADVCSNTDDTVRCLMPTISNMSRTVRRWRSKMSQAPPIPKARNGYVIPEELKFRENREKFLLFDSGEDDVNRILIFGTESNLDDLVRYKDWACDGTFKCCPDIYFQLFTLHIMVKNCSVPLIYGLLPGKSEGTYVQFFKALKSLRLSLAPDTMLIDFEKSIVTAFTKVFPDATTTGCLFHLSQNIYRKVIDMGEKVRYQNDVEFNTKVKCFTALAFLPPADVVDGFVELTDDEDIPQELVSYFETYYIGGERGRGPNRRRIEPLFPIKLWNVYGRTCDGMARTNNSVEGFHNALQSSVTNMHPNIWKLIALLKKEDTLAAKKKTDLEQGHKVYQRNRYTSINIRLQRQLLSYNKEEKLSFLKNVARNLHQ